MTMTVGEVGAAYGGCRMRLTELLDGLADDQSAMAVATCPGWSVHDVLAHVSGGIADALAGRMQCAGTDPWTARQVEERRGVPISEVLREWNENAPKVEPLLDGAGEIGRQAVADVVNHEHDIRNALGAEGARETDAVPRRLSFVAPRLIESAASRGVALRVHADDGTTFGWEDAVVTLVGQPFELLRAVSGRRSVDQIRSMSWHGDAEAVVPAFWWDPIRPASVDIHE